MVDVNVMKQIRRDGLSPKIEIRGNKIKLKTYLYKHLLPKIR